MGLEIEKYSFENEEFTEFRRHLAQETDLLGRLSNSGQICEKGFSVGIELEGWILGKQRQALAANSQVIEAIDHPQVVKELSAFNWEINGSPTSLNENFLSHLATDLSELWQHCCNKANDLNVDLMTIGTLPGLETSDLNMNSMTDQKRYLALNTEMKRLNSHKPFSADIRGRDHLSITSDSVMPASAGTSLQIHLKVPASQSGHYYNVIQLITAPLLALSANAPILFGHELWDESRIPLFESILAGPSFQGGQSLPRANFGWGYAEQNIFELFERNNSHYSVLLPTLYNSPAEELKHLQLHNGTIWPWNRPVVGQNSDDGKFHFRIEHRSMPSGPTLLDTIANTALLIGLTQQMVTEGVRPEEQLPFIMLEKNFYHCARQGLSAEVFWTGGYRHPVKDLILDQLLPKARRGLLSLGVDPSIVTFYIDEILDKRVTSGQTGAQWQRDFITTHGKDFPLMMARYLELQNSGLPVSHWPKG